MKRIVCNRWVRVWTGLCGIIGCGVLLAAALSQEEVVPEVTFDTERYAEVLAGYEQNEVVSIKELVAEYEIDQLILPIAPPAADYMVHVGRERTRLFTPTNFPTAFVEGLIPVLRSAAGRDYVAYPVTIKECPIYRDRIVYAGEEVADKRIIARIPAPNAYDPYWLLNSGFGGLDAYTSDEQADWLKAIFDPGRIVGHWDLVTGSATPVLAAAAATVVVSEEQDGIAMMSWGGGSVTNIQFVELTRSGTNGAKRVVVAYPDDFTNRISLVTCSNLLVQNWSMLMTTNPPASTNAFSYIDSAAADDDTRFYRGYNADAESDGDGVTDVQEVVDGSDPDDPDDPPNVLGHVSYVTAHGSGGQTGLIQVAAVTASNLWTSDHTDTLSEPGGYHVIQVADGTYWLKAYRDSDGNQTPGAYEAWGLYSNGAVAVTGQVSGIDIVMTDPDTDGDGLGDWWEVDYFQNLFGSGGNDPDIDKLMNLYEYYAGTDPTKGFEDDDDDGISNDWEVWFSLNKDDPADACEDPDRDGFTNLEEFLNNGGNFGTDPHDKFSHPTGAVYVDDVNGSDSTGDGSYTNAYQTISKGLAEVADGGHVAIFPGLYTGTLNRDLVIYDDIVMVGLDGSSNTIIDCEGSARAFWISSANTTNAVLRGLTIQNGDSGSQDGGAIWSTGPTLLLDSCVFLYNRTSSSYADGGAIASSGPLRIRNCIFSNNAAAYHAGAVCSTGSRLSISDSRFISNTCEVDGGAVYGTISQDATDPVIERCIFMGNSTASSGGALFFATGNHVATIRNSLFADNNAFAGGGISIGSSSAGLVVESCTISDNEATYFMGGMAFPSGVEVRNCIVWGNQPEAFGPWPVTSGIEYCCVEDWSYGGSGNITNNPLFADEEYRIDYRSPCWNAGTNQSWMADSTALFGQTRLLNSTVDMGAHELNLYMASVDNPGATTPYCTWLTAAATIQDAIEAAEGPEAIVLVTNGVYDTGSTTVDGGVPCRVALTKPIQVVSVNGSAETVIAGVGPRGASAIRCAYVSSNACLTGFTLANGHTYTSGDILDTDGGGAWCETGGQIEDCLIVDCEAWSGGGVSGGTITGCTVSNNMATYGGGIFGGMVRNCTVVDNIANQGGGLSECLTETSLITGNLAFFGGGTVDLAGGSIARNRSCLIVSNKAVNGAGSYFGIVENCTIVANTGLLESSQGVGTYNSTVRNSIVYTNSPDNWYQGSFEYSCTTPLATGDGNISEHPEFVNELSGNYRLNTNSPCVDRGEDTPLIPASEQDLDGNSRLQGYRLDMGAYESSHTNQPSPVRPDVGTNRLEISDDGYTHTGVNNRHTEGGYTNSAGQVPMAVALGFSVNYFDDTYTNVFVNNNGNLTFGTQLSTFTPEFLDKGKAVLAPFWADVDTRHIPVVVDGPVLYGMDMTYGYASFGATWTNAGYFSTHGDKTNEFQIVIVDRSEIGHGDFDVEYNYRQIDWETGDASGGTGGLGGNSARVGFGNKDGFGFELPGSGIPGSLISGGENDLEIGHLNSSIPGRYVFHFRGGWPFDILYEASMTNNPSWSYTGAWAYGTPAGQSGDPSSGYQETGGVVGYNLAGAYANNLAPTATTLESVDCSTASESLFLSYRRWLTVQTNDLATIEVRSDNGEWVEVWGSQSNIYTDTTWKHCMIDISEAAAGSSDVDIRWVMGPTDGQDVAGGWNLDEVRVLHIW